MTEWPARGLLRCMQLKHLCQKPMGAVEIKDPVNAQRFQQDRDHGGTSPKG